MAKYSFSRYRQMTVNSMPCMPLVMMRVDKPRPNRPAIPSLAIISDSAVWYEMWFTCVCFVVLMTRTELDTVSLTTDAVKPMVALRARFSSVVLYRGSFSFR